MLAFMNRALVCIFEAGEKFPGGCRLYRIVASPEEASDSTARGGIAGGSSS